jgi:hypothetical protein
LTEFSFAASATPTPLFGEVDEVVVQPPFWPLSPVQPLAAPVVKRAVPDSVQQALQLGESGLFSVIRVRVRETERARIVYFSHLSLERKTELPRAQGPDERSSPFLRSEGVVLKGGLLIPGFTTQRRKGTS